jgi:hypothetical protein
MGTPIDKIEYRDDCLVCPNLFPPGKTPKFIKIVFTGIQKCPGTTKEAPNNRVFILEPNPLDNCSWYNPSHPDYYITVTFSPDMTLVTGTDLEGPTDFFAVLSFNPICITDEISNETTCDFWEYFGGKARLFWEPDSIPFEIGVTMGFTNTDNVLSDRRSCGIDHEIIKLARRSDKTNCLFYIDKEEF